MIKAKKALLLAGASAFALLVGAAAVNAETPGRYDFVVPASGNYFLFVSGASGGIVNSLGAIGGLGAGVEGSLFLTAGEHLTFLRAAWAQTALMVPPAAGQFHFSRTRDE